MSFNIRYGSAPDGVNAWPNRRDRLLARILGISPDLLGIQECRTDGQLNDVLAGLPAYACFGVQRGGGSEAASEMAPILYRRDRFELLDSGAFWLSETPDVPGSLSWGAALPRTLTWALLNARGGRIWFGNTHFDHEGEEARLRAAGLVSAYLQERPGPEVRVLTGDFNTGKDTEPYRVLTGVLADTFRRGTDAESPAEGTFHGFGTTDPPAAIDWVLASPSLRIAGAWVDSQPGPHFLSDHYAVVVEADFRN